MEVKRVIRLVKSTVPGECAFHILTNLKAGLLSSDLPSSLSTDKFETEVSRFWRHINCLLPHAGIEMFEQCLAGKRVLVIGVGSTFGFALLLYSLGAETVVTIDPFLRNTDLQLEKRFIDYLIGTIVE